MEECGCGGHIFDKVRINRIKSTLPEIATNLHVQLRPNSYLFVLTQKC